MFDWRFCKKIAQENWLICEKSRSLNEAVIKVWIIPYNPFKILLFLPRFKIAKIITYFAQIVETYKYVIVKISSRVLA